MPPDHEAAQRHLLEAISHTPVTVFCTNACVRQATKISSLMSFHKIDLYKELANLEMQRMPPDHEAAQRHLLEATKDTTYRVLC